MFCTMKFHLDELYAIMEDEKLPFIVKEINELYDFPNDPDVYLDQRLIAGSTKGDTNKIIKLIAWPEAIWKRT